MTPGVHRASNPILVRAIAICLPLQLDGRVKTSTLYRREPGLTVCPFTVHGSIVCICLLAISTSKARSRLCFCGPAIVKKHGRGSVRKAPCTSKRPSNEMCDFISAVSATHDGEGTTSWCRWVDCETGVLVGTAVETLDATTGSLTGTDVAGVLLPFHSTNAIEAIVTTPNAMAAPRISR